MDIYRKLFHYVPEKKGYAYLAVVLTAASTVFQFGSFWYLYRFLSSLLIHGDVNQGNAAAFAILWMLLAYGILYFLGVMSTHIVAFRLETNLRKRGIENLLRASFSFFDRNESGRVRKMLDDNTEQTHMIVAHLIPDLTNALLAPLIIAVVMFIVDWRLGVLFVVMMIVSLGLLFLTAGDTEFMRKYSAGLEKMSGEAVEYIRGMPVVKIFGGTLKSFKAFYDTIISYGNIAYAYTLSCRWPFVLFQAVVGASVVFAIPIAFFDLSKGVPGSETLAKVVFYAIFSGLLYNSFTRIMYVIMYVTQASDVVDKIENLIGEMSSEEVVFGTTPAFAGTDIEFANVSFKYDNEFVLENLSFKLPAGKTYALVGSSGGGKSTIAKLISGFYKLDGGEIRIGGVPLTDYTQEAVMRHIAFVFQNTKLFKTTIYENVRIGRPDATREEIMNALSLAQCDEIIAKFPERENTLIGSKGIYLSGGEIQRIAIARAILKNADLIILDEASAAADPENEYEIQQAFANLMNGKTVIMIAHRLSAIQNVDEIIVVKDGKIAERGTNDELLRRDGEYRKLIQLYNQANVWAVS